MNCRKLAKMMPELAAGELDAWLAQDAHQHMARCQACAERYRKYAEDAVALSGPWKRFDVPEELTVPRIPDCATQRRDRLVPALSLAVVVLAAICVALSLTKPAQTLRDTVKSPAPERRQRIDVVATKHPVKHEATIAKNEDPSPKEKSYRRRSVHHRLATKIHPKVELDQNRLANVQPEQPKALPKPEMTASQANKPDRLGPDGFPSPGAVSATSSGESSMEIRWVDQATGSVTIYRSRRESPGGRDDVQLIQYDPNSKGDVRL